MRMLIALVGYLCTATVIAAVGGLTYLYSTDRLDDQKTFRIVAMLHDIDVDRIASETDTKEGVVPPEQPSLEDVEWRREVVARNHEVKKEALRRGRQVFDHSYNQLKVATDRFNQLAKKLEDGLKETSKLAQEQNVQNVVRDLEMLRPDQAKEELRQMLKSEGGTHDVIVLMNQMSKSKLKKVLQQFQTQEELGELFEIHRMLMNGGEKADLFEQSLRELDKLKSAQP